MGVGRGGVGDITGWGLAIVAQASDQLGGIGVEVVAHIGKRDFGGIKVLEGNICRFHRRLKHRTILIHLAGIIGIKGEGFTGKVHLLELILLFPGAVLHRQIHIRRITAAGIGEHPRSGIPQGDALGRGLLLGVATHEIHG